MTISDILRIWSRVVPFRALGYTGLELLESPSEPCDCRLAGIPQLLPWLIYLVLDILQVEMPLK